jgi:hypothetical protein
MADATAARPASATGPLLHIRDRALLKSDRRRFDDSYEGFFARTVRSDEGPCFGGVRCLVWTGSINTNGYGHFSSGYRLFLAHRWAYETFKGPLGGLWALHKCDNPRCVEVAHMFAGTVTDNVRDMESKGRGRHTGSNRGARNGNAKLTEEDVRGIRELCTRGEMMRKDIAALYGVAGSAVTVIANRKSWRHVP